MEDRLPGWDEWRGDLLDPITRDDFDVLVSAEPWCPVPQEDDDRDR